MINDDGGPLTSHTTNPVPFIIANGDYKLEKNAAEGALCDVAPTCLDIMVSFTARQLYSEMVSMLALVVILTWQPLYTTGPTSTGRDDWQIAPCQVDYCYVLDEVLSV